MKFIQIYRFAEYIMFIYFKLLALSFLSPFPPHTYEFRPSSTQKLRENGSQGSYFLFIPSTSPQNSSVAVPYLAIII
jgi:hypothetical protein